MINENIILLAQKGDHQAFQRLVEEFHAVAWRTARVLLRDPALAEDVLQEAWIDAWRGLPRLRHPETFRSWLLSVVANRCLMTLRRSVPATVSLENGLDALALPGETGDALAQVLRQETSTDLHAAVAALPVEQQRVLELRYFADLELSEIALVTSLPLGTVKSRLHRALNALRASLQTEPSAHAKKGTSGYEYTR